MVSEPFDESQANTGRGNLLCPELYGKRTGCLMLSNMPTMLSVCALRVLIQAAYPGPNPQHRQFCERVVIRCELLPA